MSLLRNFLNDFRGEALRSVGIAAGGVAVLSIGAALLLDGMVRAGGLPQVAITRTDGSRIVFGSAKIAPSPQFSDVDRTVTGSIGKVVIDPCTGKTK